MYPLQSYQALCSLAGRSFSASQTTQAQKMCGSVHGEQINIDFWKYAQEMWVKQTELNTIRFYDSDCHDHRFLWIVHNWMFV